MNLSTVGGENRFYFFVEYSNDVLGHEKRTLATRQVGNATDLTKQSCGDFVRMKIK